MTLGVQNVSFVAQAVDWIPEVLYDILSAAYHHKGFSFVRIIQRCPEWLPNTVRTLRARPAENPASRPRARPSVQPRRRQGLQQPGAPRPGRTSIARARSPRSDDPIPVGILYRNPDVPCYEDLRNAGQMRSTARIKAGLEAEFDKFTVWPQEPNERALPAA